MLQPIQSSVETTDLIVKATICLHNFLRQSNSTGYCSAGFVDTYDSTGEIREGEWRRMLGNRGNGGLLLNDVAPVRGSRPSKSAVEVRDLIKQHVNSFVGCVPWQWNHVRSRDISWSRNNVAFFSLYFHSLYDIIAVYLYNIICCYNKQNYHLIVCFPFGTDRTNLL